MKREAKPSPFHETTRRDAAPRAASTQRHRNGQTIDDDPTTRRSPRREQTPRPAAREEQIRRGRQARQDAPAQRQATPYEKNGHGETSKHATPPKLEGHGERATRRGSRRNDKKRTRRQVKDKGKHTTTQQDGRRAPRHDETPTSRNAKPDTSYERLPRRRYGTRRPYETARREEKREAKGHQRAMSVQSNPAPFSPAHTRTRRRTDEKRPPSSAR